MIDEALRLLTQPTPPAESLPLRIEALNVAAYDVAEHVRELSDIAGSHEESAMTEASTESNEAKRKARKCELLREDSAYLEIKREMLSAERIRFQLQERGHRYAREFRLMVAREGARL